MPTDQGKVFAGNHAGWNVWQNTEGHKTLSRKQEKKVALWFKPHILLSQMVLLSEHLALDPHWTEFLEEPRSKKKWLIWGKQTSAASFQALWFVVLAGCCTWKHFFLTYAPVSSTGHERRLIGRQWAGSRGSFIQETASKSKAIIRAELLFGRTSTMQRWS